MGRLKAPPFLGKGEGMRVVARLDGEIDADFGWLHLDGLLTFMVRRPPDQRLSCDALTVPDCPLPLRKVRGVWAATAAIDPQQGDREIEWWCFGHRPGVKRLKRMRWVGRERIPVKSWSIEVDRAIRLEHCFALDGVAQRNIPATWNVGRPVTMIEGRVAPPYWLERLTVPTIPAGAPVHLCPGIFAEGAIHAHSAE